MDDEIQAEWTYIPHFYYNFYVYQYATSFTASTAILESVLAGEDGAIAKYLDLLASGGSDYPIELLKKVGVDMTTSAAARCHHGPHEQDHGRDRKNRPPPVIRGRSE